MKRWINVLLFAALVVGIVSLASCKKTTDPEEDDEDTGPVVTYVLNNATGSGAYVSQGTATETAGTYGDTDCAVYTGTTVDTNGSICMEIQYSLDEEIDISNADYTANFDLWIDSSASDAVSYTQTSAWTAAYAPQYYNTGSAANSPTDAWNPGSVVLDPADQGYTSDSFDPTAVAMIRIKIVTAAAGDDVKIGIKNVTVSKTE